MVDSPYKFLDYYDYTEQDAHLFFGREREIKVLLADVIVNRLVVLFAKTGTGKTSLINAGVRPRLEQRGYATFFVRVAGDPTESVLAELHCHPKLTSLAGETLPEKLHQAARRLERPIVIFFDQFEEFFIYIFRRQPDKAACFIADIASVYDNRESGLNLVFSMREEFFVEMDAFRDAIPNIFHNESNLRLRWFDPVQAAEAIALPARALGVELDDDVVKQIAADLAEDGAIEPAQLQIVCDTLWRRRTGKRITLKDYRRLAGGGRAVNIARQVLFERLEDEFENIERRDQLKLLEALLPLLKTERNTKYVWEFCALVEELVRRESSTLLEVFIDAPEEPAETDPILGTSQQAAADPLRRKLEASLRRLLDTLDRSRLVRKVARDSSLLIELTHDYLVERLDELASRVRTIWPRRLLKSSLRNYEADGELIPPKELAELSELAALLVPTRREAELLMRSALTHGIATRTWFDRAVSQMADVWAVLRENIDDEDTVAGDNTIDLLLELDTTDAQALLERALDRPGLAPYAVHESARTGNAHAITLLEKAAVHPDLSKDARQLLSNVANSGRVTTEIASIARAALNRLPSFEPPSPPKQARPQVSPSRSEDAGDSATDDEGAWAPVRELDSKLTDTYLVRIADLFMEGRLTLFVGPEINLTDRPLGAKWSPGEGPPSRRELAEYLAERFNFPWYGRSWNLPLVSQYAYHIADVRQVFEAVRDALVGHEPLQVHRWLGELAQALRERLLIVTTNTDTLLEQALRDQGLAYEVVSYVSHGEGSGNFLHRTAEGSPQIVERPHEYDGVQRSGKSFPVILKLLGSVDLDDSERDSYVLAEDDYIKFVRADLSRRLPVSLVSRLMRSGFLFLGCPAETWTDRIAVTNLLDLEPQSLRFKSWAISTRMTGLELAFWDSRHVKAGRAEVPTFAEDLLRSVEFKRSSPGPPPWL